MHHISRSPYPTDEQLSDEKRARFDSRFNVYFGPGDGASRVILVTIQLIQPSTLVETISAGVTSQTRRIQALMSNKQWFNGGAVVKVTCTNTDRDTR